MNALHLRRGPYFPDYKASERVLINMYGRKAIGNLQRTQQFFDKLNSTEESPDDDSQTG